MQKAVSIELSALYDEGTPQSAPGLSATALAKARRSDGVASPLRIGNAATYRRQAVWRTQSRGSGGAPASGGKGLDGSIAEGILR